MINPEIRDVIENALARAGYEILGGTESSLVIRGQNCEADYVIRIEEDDWA